MYDLNLTPEQLEIRDTVRDFVEREVKPVVLHPDRLEELESRLPLGLVEKASRLGLRTLSLSEAAGGAGADTLTGCIVFEELAAGDAHIAVTLAETARLARTLFERAMTPAQRARFLPRFLEDDGFHLAYAGPDPDPELGWGYHRPAASKPPIALRAVRHSGREWMVNGTARYVANAPLAKLFAVAVGTGRAGDDDVLIVPHDAPGLAVRDYRASPDPSGADGSPAVPWYHGARGEVTFKDCRVPGDHVLDRDGAALFLSETHAARACLPQMQAINLGVGRAAYDAAVAYARLRVQGGRPIIEHQAIGTILAEAAIRLAVARSVVWQAAWLTDHPDARAGHGLPDLPLEIIAKVYTAEAVHEATELAAECFGAMGVMRDMPLHKYLHDARVFVQSGASNSVAKFRIAEALARYERPATQEKSGGIARAAAA